MSYLIEKYKRMLAMSMAAMRAEASEKLKKIQAKSKLSDMFGNVGWDNPRFKHTLGPVVVPVDRSITTKARKLAMRQAKRVRIDTRGYA